MRRNAFGFAHLLAAQEFQAWGPVSIAFRGEASAIAPLVAVAHRTYHPGRVLGRDSDTAEPGNAVSENAASATVCRAQACQPPVFTPDALRALLA